MKPISSFVALLIFELLCIATMNFSICNGSSDPQVCIESEKNALLRFKQDLKDPSDRLASWTRDGDCCAWSGVVCNNITGYVLQLHLGNKPLKDEASFAEYEAYERSTLGGKINPSLLDLKHLMFLDLSYNDFGGIQIPRFLGSLRSLRHLNLSTSGFTGKVPPELGNLSNLQYLAVSPNYFGDLYVDRFFWFSGLHSLKYLDLTYVDLSKASDWLSVANTLTSLEVLQLHFCYLPYLPPLPTVNFSSLAVLGLSDNGLNNTSIPSWVFSLKNLVYLDLSINNYFQGPIPDGLQNLTSLKYLDLSGNNFNSSIPQWLYRFSHLEYLSLSYNRLEGTISDALGNLTSIQRLDLSFNRLEGKISRPFGRLCSLKSIRFSDVNLNQEITEVLEIFSGCVSDGLEVLDMMNSQLSGPLNNQLLQFQNLETLRLSYNNISGSFPLFIGELPSLRHLYLSYNKLSGTLPQILLANLTELLRFSISENSIVLNISSNWVPPFQLIDLRLRSCRFIGSQFPLWLLSQKLLNWLDISNTGILDTIPDGFWKSFSQFNYVNLSHNQIHGMIPDILDAPQLYTLDLSLNNFSGPLPSISSYVSGVDLSNNAFSGSIFHFLCYGMNESRFMQVLKLKNNFLSGELPDCWMNWPHLSVLHLDNNKFTGNFPASVGALSYLESLHVRKNSFFGSMHVSLQNCTKLVQLDVAENKFVGTLPTWIDQRFSRMKILNLRSNKFRGPLPKELCHVNSLQILDVANNNLSGSIPRCIYNFSAMVTLDSSVDHNIQYPSFLTFSSSNNIFDDATLVIKSKAIEFVTNLNLIRSIDLSNNKFSGKIPVEMTSLGALQSLNLSYNLLIGRIPEKIGVMRSLGYIDLSVNQLSGKIPESILNLTFLGHLNFSNNNLTGKIPSSSRLQHLDASCFTGNELCGPPLQKNCTMS